MPVATAPTFAARAEAYVKAHKAAWSKAKHLEQWERTLATYAGPIIGAFPVDEVTVERVKEVLEPVWTTKPETAVGCVAAWSGS